MNTNFFTPRQEQEYNRSQKVKHYLANHQAQVNTFLPLQQKQTAFQLRISDLETLLSTKLPSPKEITTQKKENKKAVGLFYESVAGVAREYLLDKNNLELEANFRYTKRRFMGLKDGEVLPIVLFLNKMITNDLLPQPDFAPYDITAATLVDGLALAHTFDNSLGSKKVHNANRAAISIDIATHIKQLKKDVSGIALLMRHFQTSDPTFYKGFIAGKNIDNIGIRHTIVRGSVTIAGKTLKDIPLTLMNDKRTYTATTDLFGHYKFPHNRAGNYIITCSPPDHPPQEESIEIKRGKAKEKNWKF